MSEIADAIQGAPGHIQSLSDATHDIASRIDRLADVHDHVGDALAEVASSNRYVGDCIAAGLDRVSRSLDRLGNGNAATDFGALEAMSMKIVEGFQVLATAIEGMSEDK